ncbi:histidine phosphatase family protein [Paradevosia shaoguanensis]|uniref:histidine phosphatase family protein n=1 Tax=Paradevosia shaoguanensis TaxID=1335043 RepID=UPI0019338287|nr:histidine phosphatase family protein [Paradevosia shaoguanensis]
MALTLYITHPEVVIDPAVPTPRWGLNATGRERAEIFAARKILPGDTIFFASTEQKALDLAAILAGPASENIRSRSAFDENDRSATGFLAGAAFEEAVAALFGQPEASYRGWERAIDAQARIVRAVQQVFEEVPATTPLVFCGHGCVGTLLKCHLAGRPIRLAEDQRRMGAPGGGNVLVIDRARPALVADWVPMEDLAL